MKTRLGFVSNSSSSSFVLIGFKLNGDDKRALLEKGANKEFDVIDSPSGMCVGKTVYYDDSFYDFDEIDYLKEADDVKVKKACERFPNNKVMLIIGEYER